MIEPIEGVALSNLCDYSFGDQSGVVCEIPGAFMKLANKKNVEFLSLCEKIRPQRNYMTLFIDNIRLYRRHITTLNTSDQSWVSRLTKENSLLDLCASVKYMKFIIFTNLEDTPIDRYIAKKIPQNVIAINAVNAKFFNHTKINPFPYGLQRKLHPEDNKMEMVKNYMSNNIVTENLLYVNHGVQTNVKERSGIKELFTEKKWARVESLKIDYSRFLMNIKKHKFMICPIGRAVDCHRNWEVVYMKRVPIMKKNNYLKHLFKNYPVLFVDNYSDINEELLIKNDHLFREALNIDLNKLDLNRIFYATVNKNVLL